MLVAYMPLCCAILFRSIAPLLHCFLPVPALRVQLCVPDVLQERFPDACSTCVLQVCAPDLLSRCMLQIALQMYYPNVFSRCLLLMYAFQMCVPGMCFRWVF